MHVSVADWFVIATAVALAATVQGVVGFGGNLLAVPVVALVVPAALPGAMVLPSFPMVVTMAVTERAHVDWRGNWFLLLGRLPGTALGVGVVALVLSEVLAVVIGSVVIVALLGLSLMPSYGLGLLLSLPIRPRLHGRNLRPAVLAIAGLAGVLAIVRA